jgi:hypothetical protein
MSFLPMHRSDARVSLIPGINCEPLHKTPSQSRRKVSIPARNSIFEDLSSSLIMFGQLKRGLEGVRFRFGEIDLVKKLTKVIPFSL